MKKVFWAVVAMVILATACTKDDSTVVGNESLVSFSVSSPELQTRAYGDGAEATVLHYAFYDEEEVLLNAISAIGEVGAETQSVTLVGGKATINVPLVDGRIYSAIFWASAPDAAEVYDVNWNAKTVEMATNLTANDESYDAFYSYTINIDPANKTHKIELRRPFAQINIATKDTAAAKAAGVEVTATKVEVDAYKTLTFDTEVDTTTGEVVPVAKVSNKDTFTYDWAPKAEGKAMTDYDMLSMNYVLVNARELVDVTLRMSEDAAQTTDNNATDLVRTYTTVPVQRNYRTYIVGNLLTTQNDFTIETKPEWEKDPENDKVYYVWDGSEVKEPKVNAENNNIYEIEYASELAWLAAAVNGTLTRSAIAADDFAGKTFKLIRDIDLGGKEWTPIGSSSNPFKGTFDGLGNDGKVKTVKNLVITGNNSNVGLFGVTTNGEIKNLVVENAKVSGRLNVGVVAGNPYTSKYTNITVKGHVEVNGMAYVGGVGGKNAYANWTNITVNVDETSYVKANSVENGTAYRTYVGGVVGFNGEGGHTFSYITSNIDVEGTTCDVGGLFGIAHYGNRFENCSCSGDVTITTDDADDALEMGGIAGVWHNETGTTVTLTDCSFTGNLYAPNAGNVKFYYGGLVGKPYSATGTGKLIIGGKLYVASAAQLQAALDAATEVETTIYFGADIVGTVTDIQKEGRKVTIKGDSHKYNGTIKVHGNSQYRADAALTIEGVNFETSTASLNFIEALENGSERYSQNITVDNCTFTATGEAVDTAVGLQIKASKNAKVIGCTATNMHSLIQAQSCNESVTVESCTINGKNGVAFKQVKSAVVKGTTITAKAYGIRFDGNIDNYGITVKDNNVTAAQPLIVRKMTGKNNTITLEGTNTLATDGDYQIVITNGSDDEAYVKPTGTYTLTGAESYTLFPEVIVAKVGNTEYATIDEAIAAWTHNTTLTLLDNVTLTDVVTLKSTEHHILDLGTYTLTAATGKNAFEITPEGAGTAARSCFTINADATNPGSINAGSKSCIYYRKTNGINDRLMVTINGGVFDGTISSSSNNGGQACPYFVFNGGVFNKSVNLTKAMLKVTGGTFHGMFSCTGDSTAHRLISGGTFKSWTFMTADAANKFCVGTDKQTYNVGLYINDEGYLVVGGPVITEFGDKFAAKATNATKWSSYLKYSSAAANGLYYTNADMAIAKHGAANVVLK